MDAQSHIHTHSTHTLTHIHIHSHTFTHTWIHIPLRCAACTVLHLLRSRRFDELNVLQRVFAKHKFVKLKFVTMNKRVFSLFATSRISISCGGKSRTTCNFYSAIMSHPVFPLSNFAILRLRTPAASHNPRPLSECISVTSLATLRHTFVCTLKLAQSSCNLPRDAIHMNFVSSRCCRCAFRPFYS